MPKRHSRSRRRWLAAALGALLLVPATVSTTMFAGAADASAPRWQAQRLASGSDLVGPLVAQTSNGTLVAAYATPGRGGLYTLSWQVLHTRWSRAVNAGATISPRSGVVALAANTTRVVTVTGVPSSSGVRYAVQEFTLRGRRLFSRANVGGTSPTVAIDASNVATVVTLSSAGGTSAVRATTFSTRGYASTRALQSTVGGADDSPFGLPQVAAVGAHRLAAVWTVNSGNGYGSVRTALLTSGRWGPTGTLAWAGRSVATVGFAGNAIQGLLTFTPTMETASGEAPLRAAVDHNGHWERNYLVDRTPAYYAALENGQAVAHNGALATVTNRVFSLGASARGWRAGLAVPHVSRLCGGDTNASAYSVNTLHHFAVASVGSRCVLYDFHLA